MFKVDGSKTWQNAKEKAAGAEPAVLIEMFGVYRVEGSGGNYYNVQIGAEGQETVINCNCLAGTHDRG